MCLCPCVWLCTSVLSDAVALLILQFTSIPDEIVPGLWLGDVGAARNATWLTFISIRYILTVCNDANPAFPEDYNYTVIPMLDTDLYTYVCVSACEAAGL